MLAGTAPDWDRYPDDHPGWDRLLNGMARIARIHGVVGHDCRACLELRNELNRRHAA